MASINGISLKKVSMFRGHEGEPCYQGDVYLNNKKIGFWSEDAWGAIVDNVRLDFEYSESALRKAVESLNPDKARHITRNDGSTDTFYYSLEDLFSDLLTLIDHEKAFKKAVKEGFKGLAVASDSYNELHWKLSEYENNTYSDTELYILLNVEKQKQKAGFFKESEDSVFKHSFDVYRNGFAFKVGKAINIKDIERKPVGYTSFTASNS